MSSANNHLYDTSSITTTSTQFHRMTTIKFNGIKLLQDVSIFTLKTIFIEVLRKYLSEHSANPSLTDAENFLICEIVKNSYNIQYNKKCIGMIKRYSNIVELSYYNNI